MPNYIKTKSKYVKEKTHQVINDGKILERDWSTIGGITPFLPDGQTSIYADGNFLVSVGNAKNISYDRLPENWVSTESGYTEWTLDDAIKSNDYYYNSQSSLTLSNKTYDLRSYAYFGSCKELFRASISDILRHFPGELFVTSGNITYYNSITESNDIIGKENSQTCYVSNPFGINIHDQIISIPNTEDNLRYFANDGFKEYEVIYGSQSGISINKIDIVTYPKTEYGRCNNITLTLENGSEIEIGRYYGESCSVTYYMTNISNIGIHIRPKNKLETIDGTVYDRRYYDNFILALDNFESVLLNPNTYPKYKSTFDIIKENENGFYFDRKSFVFPHNDGGYNIGNDTSFKSYLSDFNDIGELYDSYFSDNIYRMLTHEPIKNFDWSYMLSKSENNEDEDFSFGTSKIESMLRIYGREFDNIKQYIDTMSYGNNVSYDGINNIPDYLLTDILSYDGWDLKNIFTYDATKNEDGSYKFHENEKKFDGIAPYSHENSSAITKEEKNGTTFFVDQTYDENDINNEFFRRLKINSRYILREKGTIDGIEKVLSLFGLRSKKWCKKFNSANSKFAGDKSKELSYDYTIKEYTTFMYPIIDGYNKAEDMGIYDYYNKSKLITYDNDDFRNGVYDSYIGLPVIAFSGSNSVDGKDYSHLYPYFDKNSEYDGGLYYQMNGGWMKISPFDFDNNGNVVSASNVETFTQTYRTIKQVDNIQELLSMPSEDVTEGMTVYVDKIQNDMVVIDSSVYSMIYDTDGNEKTLRYLSFNVEGNSVTIGTNTYYGNITASLSDGDINVYNLETMSDGDEIRVYVYKDGNDEDAVYLYSDNKSFNSVNFFNTYYSPTHYYRLMSIDGAGQINSYGWNIIAEDDDFYKNINRIKNYFNGNNPHHSSLEYDNGYSYMNSFYHLFGYSLKNNLLDDTVFSNSYETKESLLSGIGFANYAVMPGEKCSNDYPEIEDDKIHVFAKQIIGNEEKEEAWLSGDTIYSAFTTSSSVRYYLNKYGTDVDVLKYILPKNFDSNTYSVVNTKRVDINFKKGIFDDFNNIENSKYLLSVINNYVQQVVPSNIICHLNFNS